MPDTPLPMSTVFDEDAIDDVIYGSAGALATQLALSSGWKPDEGFIGWLTNGGAQSVDIDGDRRRNLRDMLVRDFSKAYAAQFAISPAAGLTYLETLVDRAGYAMKAVSEQFEMARRINSGVSESLNDAIDRTYRIRTMMSVAFVVVGSWPVAAAAAGAGGVASFTMTGVGGVSLAAAQGSTWALAVQVAGIGGIYGFFTELAFNKEDVKRSGAGLHLSSSGQAAAMGAGGNLAQTGVEQVRLVKDRALVSSAELESNRLIVRQQAQNIRAEVVGRRAIVRPLVNEADRQLARHALQRSRDALTVAAGRVAATTSVLFIVPGVYMMREDIADAFKGLTRDIDRTR